MSNRILIRRSVTAGDAGTQLSAGELGFSYVSNKLYIGNVNGIGNGAIAIGGPGILSSYAPLDSATLTGTPTAPTPALNTNNTSIATTAFVKAQSYITQNDVITINGDASGNGRNTISLSLSNTGVSQGTYTKITVDTKGRVITGDILTSLDIPTLTAGKISDFDTAVRINRLDQLAAPTSSVSFNSQIVSNIGDPVNDTDAANKKYVDAARSGLDVKQSVRVSTDSNINISAPGESIDTITLTPGDRILLRGQTDATQNGIYIYNSSSSALTRATDADSNLELSSGLFTFVEEGSSANSGFVLSTPNPIILGTSNLTFSQFSGAGQIEAGAGVVKEGNTLSLNLSNALTFYEGKLDLNSIIIPGTFTKVTVDGYGRVSSGYNPTTLADYNITDAVPYSNILSYISSIETTDNSAGFLYYSGSGVSTYDLLGRANQIDVVDLTQEQLEISISSSYIGQSSITTVGTIATGTWNSTPIGIAYGGTGNTAFAANNIPFSTGTTLSSSINLTWNDSSKVLTLNGTLDSALIDGGLF